MPYTIDNSQLNYAPTSSPSDAPGGSGRGLDIANSVFGWLGQINNSVFSWLNPDQVQVGIGSQPNNNTYTPAGAPAPAADNTVLYLIAGVVAVALIGGIIYVVAKKK